MNSQFQYTASLPFVEINLDLPPKERWEPLRSIKKQTSSSSRKVEVIDLKDLVRDTRKYIDKHIGFSFALSTNKSIVIVRTVLFAVVSFFAWLFFNYNDDLRALAVIMNAHPGEIVMANFIYECSVACTSFIAHDKLTGRPIHGRSLDWPFQKLARYTTHFSFTRDNGRCRYDVIGWPGMTGYMTAVKPGVGSVSLNARFAVADKAPSWFAGMVQFLLRKDVTSSETTGYYILFNTITTRLHMMVFGGWTTGHIIRYAIEKAQSYDEMRNILQSYNMLAPCYFIVAGMEPNEGCCITRDPLSFTTRHMLDEDPNIPFIVQTNDDYDDIQKWATARDNGAPEGFNSCDRYTITSNWLKVTQGVLSIDDASILLCSSLKKNSGVRMQITLYMCIMMPSAIHENGMMFSVRSTRSMGGS